MKISAIAIALCLAFSGMPQMKSFEKQALTLGQETLASDLDATLPKRPFAAWFNQLVGPEAGVVWQLTDCGERIDASKGPGQDLPACAEVNACLPDGRVVIVMITVGSFKKGLIGKPAFFRAVVERDHQLSQTLRLRDVPGMLNAPKALSISSPVRKTERGPVTLPAIDANRPLIKLPFEVTQLLPPGPNLNLRLNDLNLEEIPPPPQPVPQELQKLSEGRLQANAITRAKPVYPQNAKMLNAFGEVKVQIMISESGRVVEAKAISGRPALRGAAVEAAYKWVFKPIIFNGMPVKAEGILTFNFMPGAQ